MTYKLITNQETGKTEFVLKIPEMIHIPCDPANTHYMYYLKWVAEGNIPEPADNGVNDAAN